MFARFRFSPRTSRSCRFRFTTAVSLPRLGRSKASPSVPMKAELRMSLVLQVDSRFRIETLPPRLQETLRLLEKCRKVYIHIRVCIPRGICRFRGPRRFDASSDCGDARGRRAPRARPRGSRGHSAIGRLAAPSHPPRGRVRARAGGRARAPLLVVRGAIPRAGQMDATIPRPVGGPPRQVRRRAQSTSEGAGRKTQGDALMTNNRKTGKGREENTAQKLTTFLTFNDQAEEAVKRYVSIFKNSRIVSMVRGEAGGPITKGKVLNATFELDGARFMAMDGGPYFTFAQGTSLFVSCDTQEEIDWLWERLSEGGEQQPCAGSRTN